MCIDGIPCADDIQSEATMTTIAAQIPLQSPSQARGPELDVNVAVLDVRVRRNAPRQNDYPSYSRRAASGQQVVSR